MGRPKGNEIEWTHIKIESNILMQLAHIFEKDAKLSKLERRDDTSRIRFLLEEFIRSDGKCINWYQDDKPKLEAEMSRIKARLETIENMVRKI